MPKAYPFKNLVFEGGGTLGTAYVGVMQELENRNIPKHITRVGGASAGAINAALFALGYTAEETWNILKNLNYNTYQDYSIPGRIDCLFRLFSNYGFYPGNTFKQWMKDLIAKKTGRPNLTFKECSAMGLRDLYLVGTNLNTSYYEIYSPKHSPDVPIVDAVRISMSIPLIFAAVRDSRGYVNVDGGVLDNYPIRLFDRGEYVNYKQHPDHLRAIELYDVFNANIDDFDSRYMYNCETLGFRLDSAQTHPIYHDATRPALKPINNLIDYLNCLIQAYLNIQSNTHLETDDWHRTVYIDTRNISGFDFNIGLSTKETLVEAGRKGVKEYFEWYDRNDINDYPRNKPDYENVINRKKKVKSAPQKKETHKNEH